MSSMFAVSEVVRSEPALNLDNGSVLCAAEDLTKCSKSTSKCNLDNCIRYALEHDYIHSSNPLIPLRIRHVLRPGLLDFEQMSHVWEVSNRIHCSQCTEARHAKIVNWLVSHKGYIDADLFNMRKLLSHVDEMIFEYLTGHPKYARGMRRYLQYMPRNSPNVERMLKTKKVSDRIKERTRTLVRQAQRDLKYGAQLGFDVNVKHHFEESQFEELRGALSHLTDLVGEVPSRVLNYGSSLVKEISTFVLGFVTMCISIYRHPNTVDVSLAITSFLSHFIKYIDISYDELQRAMEQVAQWMCDKFGSKRTPGMPDAYSAQLCLNPLGNICDIFTKIVCKLFGLPKELFNFIRPHNSTLRDLSNMIVSIEKLAVFFVKYFDTTIQAIKNYFCPPVGSCEYLDYIEEVRLFLNPDYLLKLKRDDMPAVVRKCNELYNRGLVLNKSLNKSVDPVRAGVFIRTFALIGSLQKTVSPYYFTDKLRISPYIISLSGGSGKGKSHLNQIIPKAMYSHPRVNVPIATGEARSGNYKPGEDVYVRNFAQKFWDGYSNQRVVIFDDFLQMRSAESMQASLQELILVSNNNPYPLNMADITDKGCVRFTSDMVMITTNVKLTDQELRQHVSSPVAIERRIHETIVVDLRPEFQDPKGVYKGQDDKFHPQAWVFSIPSKGLTGLNLLELIDYLVDGFLAHRTKDHEMINASESACDYNDLFNAFRNDGLKAQVDIENPEDDLPDFPDFRPQLDMLGRHARKESATDSDEFHDAEGERPVLALMDTPNIDGKLYELDRVIRHNYANGRILESVGITVDQYFEHRLWESDILKKRMRFLIKMFHRDRRHFTGGFVPSNESQRIISYLYTIIGIPEFIRDIYMSRIFAYYGTSTDCKAFRCPSPDVPLSANPYNLDDTTQFEAPEMADQTIFNDAGFLPATTQGAWRQYTSDSGTTTTDFRTWRRYFGLRGFDVDAFWLDVFLYDSPVTNRVEIGEAFYRAVYQTGDDTWIPAVLTYFGSVFITVIGFNANAEFNIPGFLYAVGAGVVDFFVKGPRQSFYEYYVNGSFTRNICKVGMAILNNFVLDPVYAFKAAMEKIFYLMQSDECTFYGIYSNIIIACYNYSSIMQIIGVISICLSLLVALVNYVFNSKEEEEDNDDDSDEEDEHTVGEAYVKKDSVKASTTLKSESYAKKDSVKAGTQLKSEVKKSKKTKAKLRSEVEVPKDKNLFVSDLTEKIQAEGQFSIEDVNALRHFRAEISTDANAVDLMVGKLRSNLVCISACDGNKFFINGIFIRGKIMLAPYHLKHTLECFGSTDVEISGKVFYKNRFNLLKHIVYEDKSHDVILVEVPCAQEFCDIVPHFYKDEEINNNAVYTNNGSLMTYATKHDTVYLKLCDKIEPKGKIVYSLDAKPGESHDYQIVNSWGYVAETASGDCGGVLVLHNKGVGSKILGMHVAGRRRYGISVPLGQEYMRNAISKISKTVAQVQIPVLPAQANGIITLEDRTQYLGEVASQYQYRVPTKSKLQESPFYGVFPPLKKPVNLRPFHDANGKLINPIRTQIEKQFIPPILIDEDVLDEAYMDLNSRIQSLTSDYKNATRKIWNENETLNGVDGDDHISPMNMKTSPGYPWIFHCTKPGKYSLLEGEPGAWTLKSEIRDYIAEVEQELGNLIVRPFIWADCLKDEKREHEKVDVGKTRVFNVGPFELTYLTRKYFGSFVAHLTQNKLDEVSVGVNVHSNDWDCIRKQLSTFELNEDGSKRKKFLMCGDYSNYDKRLPYCLIEKALDIMNNWYKGTEFENNVRKSIFIATFNALHICGRTLYRCGMGNPSGCAITAQINSMVNSLLARCIFIILGREQKPQVPISQFSKNIVYKSYGDDNLASVSIKCPWFNMRSFERVCAQYGIGYTSASKGDISEDYVGWEDASYLKRRFIPDTENPNWTWAPLDMSSITEMMMWLKNNEMSMQQIMQSTFNSFMNELGHYPKEVYDKHVNAILERSYEIDMYLAADSHETTRMRIKDGLVKE